MRRFLCVIPVYVFGWRPSVSGAKGVGKGVDRGVTQKMRGFGNRILLEHLQCSIHAFAIAVVDHRDTVGLLKDLLNIVFAVTEVLLQHIQRDILAVIRTNEGADMGSNGIAALRLAGKLGWVFSNDRFQQLQHFGLSGQGFGGCGAGVDNVKEDLQECISIADLDKRRIG